MIRSEVPKEFPMRAEYLESLLVCWSLGVVDPYSPDHVFADTAQWQIAQGFASALSARMTTIEVAGLPNWAEEARIIALSRISRICVTCGGGYADHVNYCNVCHSSKGILSLRNGDGEAADLDTMRSLADVGKYLY